MGWGVTDCPSRPESGGQSCTSGCEMTPRAKSYECRAKACKKDNLCIGCVYTCADCEEDYCFDHVLDINPKSAPDAIYVCLPCRARRQPIQEEKAA